MKAAASLVLSFMTFVTQAETIDFQCQGVVRGEDIDDSPTTFEIVVNTDSGEINGFPGWVAPGCIKPYKIDFKIDARQAQQSCSSHAVESTSVITLSRLTGHLTISTLRPQKNKRVVTWNGEFACQKIAGKMF